MADIITFDSIRKIQMEEKSSSKLTQLPENFYELAKDYLNKKDADTPEKMTELKNIKRMLEDIFNRRERKIINFAIIAARTGLAPENMTKEETEFFNKLVELIKGRRKAVLESLFKKEEGREGLIVFKEDVPSFIGVDGQEYGPFSKGDIAKVPKENAELLVKQGYAEWLS